MITARPRPLPPRDRVRWERRPAVPALIWSSQRPARVCSRQRTRPAAQTWAIDEEANQKAKGATLSPAGPPTGTPSVVKSLSESGPLPTPVASAASFFTVSFVMIDLLILRNLLFVVFGWRRARAALPRSRSRPE